MRRLLLLTLPCLLLAGCPSDEPPECPPGACEPHGVCVEGSDRVYCDCDFYYEQLQPDDLRCIERDMTPGYCRYNSDCPDGLCIGASDYELGYCSSTGCSDNADCVNPIADDPRAMCCVEDETGSTFCQLLAEGYECGDGTATCGMSCTGTLDSACGPGLRCLYSTETDPKAHCSHPCETYSDCEGCYWDVLPGRQLQCETISGGERWCLIGEYLTCYDSTDCPEGDTCTIGVNADLTDLFAECTTYGGLPPGSDCNDEDDPIDLSFEERCSGLYCLGGKCSEICRDDSTCPEGMECVETTFEQVDDSIFVCQGI